MGVMRGQMDFWYEVDRKTKKFMKRNYRKYMRRLAKVGLEFSKVKRIFKGYAS